MDLALNIALRIGSPSLTIEAYKAIADMEEQLGNYSSAFNAMKGLPV